MFIPAVSKKNITLLLGGLFALSAGLYWAINNPGRIWPTPLKHVTLENVSFSLAGIDYLAEKIILNGTDKTESELRTFFQEKDFLKNREGLATLSADSIKLTNISTKTGNAEKETASLTIDDITFKAVNGGKARNVTVNSLLFTPVQSSGMFVSYMFRQQIISELDFLLLFDVFSSYSDGEQLSRLAESVIISDIRMENRLNNRDGNDVYFNMDLLSFKDFYIRPLAQYSYQTIKEEDDSGTDLFSDKNLKGLTSESRLQILKLIDYLTFTDFELNAEGIRYNLKSPDADIDVKTITGSIKDFRYRKKDLNLRDYVLEAKKGDLSKYFEHSFSNLNMTDFSLEPVIEGLRYVAALDDNYALSEPENALKLVKYLPRLGLFKLEGVKFSFFHENEESEEPEKVELSLGKVELNVREQTNGIPTSLRIHYDQLSFDYFLGTLGYILPLSENFDLDPEFREYLNSRKFVFSYLLDYAWDRKTRHLALNHLSYDLTPFFALNFSTSFNNIPEEIFSLDKGALWALVALRWEGGMFTLEDQGFYEWTSKFVQKMEQLEKDGKLKDENLSQWSGIKELFMQGDGEEWLQEMDFLPDTIKQQLLEAVALFREGPVRVTMAVKPKYSSDIGMGELAMISTEADFFDYFEITIKAEKKK